VGVFRVTQQARQLVWKFAERERSVRFLIRDHDRKFTGSFDAIFEAQGARIIRTPVQVPEAIGDQVKLPDKKCSLF
jgi:hypothetical protein